MHSVKVLGGWSLALLVCVALGAAPARASEASVAIAHVAAVDGTRLVAIVAADIDADGDLDVVASDGGLQLHVWVNDGRGHFTRRGPSPASAWQLMPPAPSVDGGPAAPQSAAQLDPQTPDTGRTAGARTPRPAAALARGAATPLVTADRAARTPRAPPRPGSAGA